MGKTSPRSDAWKTYWDAKREKRQQLITQGHVVVTQMAAHLGYRIQVVCPQDVEFTHRAKLLGGRWRPRTGVWTFASNERSKVIALCKSIYGDGAVRVVSAVKRKSQPPTSMSKPTVGGEPPPWD